MSHNETTIFYIGPLMYGGTCLQRMWALQALGYRVFGLDTGIPSGLSFPLRTCHRVWRRIFAASYIAHINARIVTLVRDIKPNLIWIDKGLFITRETLRKAKELHAATSLISFSPDDMLNPNNQSKDYLECLPLYDYHITTKTYNVAELTELGGRDVIVMDNAYCERSHKPVLVSSEDRKRLGGQVGFVGFWEREREEYMSFLAENGIPVRIWGPWNKSKKYHRNLRVEGRVAWGDDYAATLCAFDINLCFLRKENRDLQTTRSIEIPACGSFMLGERSTEHLRLFSEGIEAEFFGSKDELLQKVRYYIEHENERRRIGEAGRRRCSDGHYSYKKRLEKVLQNILEHSKGQCLRN